MQTLNQLSTLRSALAPLRGDGPLALVPTMGALHEGHLSLVRAAKQRAAHVVVSIFVNPRQFGVGEDLDAYPRPIERDAALLAGEGTAVLWAPTVAEMYPSGYATNIAVSGVSEGLCGGARPGHFDGVATVVAKLFNQVQPDIALFGEKDWQQLAVIRRMARDLDFAQPHVSAILGVATMREADGLAMSSRNAYLTPAERAAAPSLPRAMHEAIARIESGEPAAPALAALESALLAAGFASVDYAELRDADTLAPLAASGPKPARLIVAARLGKARLIDNMAAPVMWRAAEEGGGARRQHPHPVKPPAQGATAAPAPLPRRALPPIDLSPIHLSVILGRPTPRFPRMEWPTPCPTPQILPAKPPRAPVGVRPTAAPVRIPACWPPPTGWSPKRAWKRPPFRRSPRGPATAPASSPSASARNWG